MRIRSSLLWLTAIGFGGLVIFAAIALTALFRVEINGAVYRQISLTKDLISDYAPPSQSLLQVALICSMMDKSRDPSQLEREFELFRAAETNFEKEHAYYMRHVPEGRLKEMMGSTAYETAQQYFEIAQQEFIPLIQQGNYGKARQVLVSRMNPIYEKHASAVDQIVAVANQEALQGERLAAKLVRSYTELMAGGGLAILAAGLVLSSAIARGVSRQAGRLIRSEASRREQAELLNSVLAGIAEGVVFANPEGKFRVWNTTAEKLFGPAPADLKIDQWAAQYGFYLSDEKTLCPTNQLPLVRAMHGEQCEMELLTRNTRAGGDRWLEITARPIKDDSGTVLGGVTVFRDTTERKAMLAALEQAQVELEERVRLRTEELRVAKEAAESADRFKSAFLATMSHELRTPLNSIIGFTGIALQGLAGPLNPEQKTQLQMVKNSARLLLSLINDVLDLSKIEADQLELRSAPFDVRESIEKVVRSVLPQAQRKGLGLHTEIATGIGTLVNDCRRVEQVLLNLLSNAIKFTERGGVYVQCRLEDGWLVTSVRDSGIGIRPEDLDRLFRPFQQLESGLTRRHEGTGLGLSICKKLIELMGGTISVESQPGHGSTFTYRLPMGGKQ